MKLRFTQVKRPSTISPKDWTCWKWQLRHSVQSFEQWSQFISLTKEEKEAIQQGELLFSVKATPYQALMSQLHPAIRKMTIPSKKELSSGGMQMKDPLGENNHNPVSRIIHRYPDRVLFLITDFCGMYCRYCTRKHFTSKGHFTLSSKEYKEALEYISSNQGIREVILSGGDPLTLSDSKLDFILADLRSIEHIEIIRIGTRMPVACPFRITNDLLNVLKKYQPVFIMTHFNHPAELTEDCKNSLLTLSDGGISVFNQMVLLNGINNHPALVQALCRRLLYLRVKPYYMFQCDPSLGSDHFRTSIENSKWIQKELWGVLSGLANPKLSVDLPGGGGKVELSPDQWIQYKEGSHFYEGFDGMKKDYKNPIKEQLPLKEEMKEYLKEWEMILSQPYGSQTNLKTKLKKLQG